MDTFNSIYTQTPLAAIKAQRQGRALDAGNSSFSNNVLQVDGAQIANLARTGVLKVQGTDSGKTTGPGAVKRNASNRIKYVCPLCCAAVWGKPNMRIVCGDCEKRFVAEEY